MKTAVSQTSIDAYYNINLNQQQQTILHTLRITGESCIADIAANLKWERSTVSGRLNELKKCGLVQFVEKRKSLSTGIKSEFYKVRNQETLF